MDEAAKHSNHIYYETAVSVACEVWPELLPRGWRGKEDRDLLAAALWSGNCGWVVYQCGREFAAQLLNSVSTIVQDADCEAALMRAIAECVSMHDTGGALSSIDEKFVTPAYLARHALSPVTDDEVPPVELSERGHELLAVICGAYLAGGNEVLPVGLREFRSDRDFISSANCLDGGNCGDIVYWYGREFARLLLPGIIGAGAYDLVGPMERAIEAGETWADNHGHLPAGSPETTTATCPTRGFDIKDDWMMG